MYIGIGAGALVLIVILLLLRSRRAKGGVASYMEEVRLLVAAGKLKEAAAIQRTHGNLKEALNLLERGKNFKEASRVAAELELYPRAADLAEKAKEFERAADLYWKAGDFGKAGKLYKRNGLFRKAAEAFEKDSESTMEDIAQMWEKACLQIMPEEAIAARNEADLQGAILCAGKAAEAYKKAGNNERAALLFQMAQRHDEARRVQGKDIQSVAAKMTQAPAGFGGTAAPVAPLAHTGDEARLAQVVGHAVKAALDQPKAAPMLLTNLSSPPARDAGAVGTGVSVGQNIVREIVYVRDQATKQETAVARSNDRYEIGDKLGEGGMAVVYRALDKVLDREVAMKFLPEGLTENVMALKYFQREAKAAAGINHRNVVTIYDCGVLDDRPFICMELVAGTPLDERLDQCPDGLPIGELLDVAEGMISGLQAAHERGVVHRDIKPSNLMTSEEGVVKLMDFGIASGGDPSKSTIVAGTPHYMAPEQFIGKGIDHRTDLFAVGVTLYELLTGVSAYDSADRVQLPRPPRKLRPETPFALDRMILSCLAREPADRPDSAAALLQVIRAVKLERTREAEALGAIAEPLTGPPELTDDPDSFAELFEDADDISSPSEPRVSTAETLLAAPGRPIEAPDPSPSYTQSGFPVTVDPEATDQDRFLARALALEPNTGPPIKVDPQLGRARVETGSPDDALAAYLNSKPLTARATGQAPSEDEEILSLDAPIDTGSLDEEVKDILADYLNE